MKRIEGELITLFDDQDGLWELTFRLSNDAEIVVEWYESDGTDWADVRAAAARQHGVRILNDDYGDDETWFATLDDAEQNWR